MVVPGRLVPAAVVDLAASVLLHPLHGRVGAGGVIPRAEVNVGLDRGVGLGRHGGVSKRRDAGWGCTNTNRESWCWDAVAL